MSAFEFMGAHPVLTFFLAYFVAWTIVNGIKAMRGGTE